MNNKKFNNKIKNTPKSHPKELRKKILQEFYRASEGNIWKSISYDILRKNLIIKDEEKFQGEIKYLVDKGFLKYETIAEVQITTYGIDESEAKFPSFVEIGEREFHIPAGAYYTGRKNLRKILMTANKEITIIDNFLHPEILMVVEPYLDKDKVIIIKFLTRKEDNRNFRSFVSDLKKFKKQYSNFQIEARCNDKFHDRYIIIDSNIVYHSGHSFHDLGKKGSRISRMEDEGELSKFWDDSNNWWDKGDII